MERLGRKAGRLRRKLRLRGTPAEHLRSAHIGSLELLEMLRPLRPRVVFDIGANIGTWTLLAKSIFPECTVHAFEPLRGHADKFAGTVELLAGVLLHEMALGAEPGTLPIHVTRFSDASSILMPLAQGHTALTVAEDVMVPIARLDDLLKRGDVPPPDVVKIDVQGYELEVFRGAEQALAHARAVISEVSFQESYSGQALFHNVVAFLAERGFFVRAFSWDTWTGREIGQTDVLFSRRPAPAAQ
jgi:FkbM family methyltransferase